MKAAVIQGYGGADRFEIQDLPCPEPGGGEILIRIRAAGVNPLDCKIREGNLRYVMPARFPLVLGFDAAGVVEAVGPEVTDFEPGDRVYAYLDQRHGGAYAGFAVARQAVASPIPEALSFEEAAVLPLASLTALQALRDKGEVQPADEVLIHGASGGVGHLAVQIARILGARVTAVASGPHREMLLALGADRFIDYLEEDFLDRDETYRIIFDVVGNLSFQDCDPVLAERGVYITTRTGPGAWLSAVKTSIAGFSGEARRSRMIMVHPDGADLDEISGWVTRGLLRPVIDQVFPLEEIRQAHEAVESGHTRGKVVIRVEGAD
ncbi:MAG TPA: NADP-dependent oxidoreductase [Thermoanaerobaculia bacterium]|nr:NADP-dependent oxidoreductase [Thermoanaerobaculia bacterium]